MLGLDQQIEQYFLLADFCSIEFCRVFDVYTPLAYWGKDRNRNKTGTIGNGIRFDFHGNGCSFYFDGFIRDGLTVDYTSNLKLAVSAWTLAQDISKRKHSITQKDITDCIAEQNRIGLIRSAFVDAEFRYNVVSHTI